MKATPRRLHRQRQTNGGRRISLPLTLDNIRLPQFVCPSRAFACFAGLSVLISSFCLLPSAFPQGTAFTYQGRLTDGTNLASGTYDLRFTLFDSASAGNSIGPLVPTNGLPVNNGLFTVVLDFGGGAFTGADRWLEIGVRTNGSGGDFATLAPRQPLTPTPYAIHAGNAKTFDGHGTNAFAPATGSPEYVRKAGDTMTGTLQVMGDLHLQHFDFSTSAGGGPSHQLTIAPVSGNSVNDGVTFALSPGGGAYGYFDITGEGNPLVHFGLGARTAPSFINTPGDFSFNGGGNVGIGTTSPGGKLEVLQRGGVGSGFSTPIVRLTDNTVSDHVWDIYGTDGGSTPKSSFRISDTVISTSAESWRFVINENGNVGLGGETTPASVLSVKGGATVGGSYSQTAAPTDGMIIQGNVGIGTTSPQAKLHVVGDLRTSVLTITGGADVAEPFAMSEPDLPKGAVVIIDEERPGQLKLSAQPYDTRVAGIISGAGGVNSGLTLSQQGALEGGQNVALSGRVYALADATADPIKPGDLLTTSATPGHCMKATDRERAGGAILGKAMSSLKEGKGLVLVLVSLQ